MARPRKAPAFLVDVTVQRSAKLASLSSDTARLGFFYAVLAGAKLGDTQGRFASRSLFRELGGRFARFLGEYLAAGILEEAPSLCDRCRVRARTDPPADGVLLVHDWDEHQYDPGKLERDRVYEGNHPDRSHGPDAPVSVGVSGAQSVGVSDGVSVGVSVGKPDGEGTGPAGPRARVRPGTRARSPGPAHARSGAIHAQSVRVSDEFPSVFPSPISHARHASNVEHPSGRTNGLTGTPAKRGARDLAPVDPVEATR
jgi:hypothetical protein